MECSVSLPLYLVETVNRERRWAEECSLFCMVQTLLQLNIWCKIVITVPELSILNSYAMINAFIKRYKYTVSLLISPKVTWKLWLYKIQKLIWVIGFIHTGQRQIDFYRIFAWLLCKDERRNEYSDRSDDNYLLLV